jgi:flagellar biosynthesis/type III secretory pathway protein FliH
MGAMFKCEILKRLERIENLLESLTKTVDRKFSQSEKRMDEMAETIVEKITRESAETRGAVATMANALDTFSAYVLAHLNDPAALEAAASELQAAQDDIALSLQKNPLPGEVVVTPPVEPTARR